ncbi:MAG: flagellar biosynthesis protein FlgL [Sulfurimonas sp.]|nr:flagellar biosynthesis protein FlgL [Sulfurimonas sp.]
MRITQSMYYKNLYGTNNENLQTRLFDVNKQIASGLKIQYASDDVATFAQTMRLDNEITTLAQIKKSTQNGFKVSTQSDDTLNNFVTSMTRMKTLLIQAGSGVNDETSLDAIALELRGQESHLKNLANTSINGQFLFSGSAVDVKPISEDGTYNGNATKMNSFLGSNASQQYNISGAELFLGEESSVRREITTNVTQNLNAPTGGNSLSESSTLGEFMGLSPSNQQFFYLRGVQSNGTAFNQKVTLTNAETVGDLLTQIGNAYGNTIANKVVDVSLSGSGQIVIADKLKGSSKLDFHMVGATDFDGTLPDNADVTNVDALDSGSNDYTTASGGPGLYVREFMKSGFTQSDSVSAADNNLEGILYDRTKFSVTGNTVSSNIAQINKDTNAFATPSTKILDVASGTTLDTKQFQFSGTNVSGTAFDVQIDFANAGSTFTLDGGVTTYDIFDVGSPRAAVSGDDMTYQQLMDVINMVTTGNLPANSNALGNDAQEAIDYDAAIKTSNFAGTTSLSNDGKIEFGDLNFTTTQVTMSLHDSNSGDFTQPASVLSFNSNNALTVRDAKTDFFKTIDELIKSVENHITYPDSTVGNQRSVGIENSIAMMEDLFNHTVRSQSIVGANSNALTSSLERTEILDISTKTLRSEVVDTDLAESALRLTQLTLNYEAMLSTVGKVSKLSLVNYL